MITASQLYSHLVCPTRVANDAFSDPALRDPVSPFVQLLWDRGALYEREVVAGLAVPFVDLSALTGVEKEAATRAAIARREPLIHAGRLSVDDLLGEPDLLRLEGDGYVALDIKSGAGDEGGGEPDADPDEPGKPKKTYGAQLALYTDILIRLGIATGRHAYILDVHGREVRYDFDVRPGPRSPTLWEVYLDTRTALGRTLAGERPVPAASSDCKQCVWRSACRRELDAAGDLTLIPELGRARRDAMARHFPSIADLAAADMATWAAKKKTGIAGVGITMLRRFHARARLLAGLDEGPYLSRPVSWPVTRTELFFDIEVDPLRDLCYLHGFVVRDGGGDATERFIGIYVDDLDADAERRAFGQAMAVFRAFPDAAVIHYSPYERTIYRRLQARYPDVATAEEVEALFVPGRALDLYHGAVRTASEWPTNDYSIKSLAKHCGFHWRDADPSGASSIEWFDRWAKTRDAALRERLLAYNEDDCRAMRVVMDAMKALS